MNIITLDFETYFDDEYSLKKMTTEAYVRDPRFKVLGLGVRRWDGLLGFYANPDDVRYHLQKQTLWHQTSILCHHAQFDGLILSHHFGIKPAFWFDTLSMARQIHGNHISASLESLARHYKLEPKNVPYDLFRGKRWHELSPGAQKQVADGCLHDVDLTWRIFQKMATEPPAFPQEEYKIVDLTIRMFTEPMLQGDTKLFERVRDEEFFKKSETLYSLGVSKADLASDQKFAAILEAEGVDVETKTTPKGNVKPAVAKSDRFMQELLEHDNERIATLAQCRLDVRSTLAETRAGRLYDMSLRGPLCVYLGYCAAHTTRWGGGDKVNFQNLPRRGGLRDGILAPDGMQLVRIDQSQGECRIVNWLASQKDVIARFEKGEDPYLPVASAFYGYQVTKDEKEKRQLGKVIELAGGFGIGAAKIKATARAYGIELTDIEAERAKFAYRSTHQQVVNYWDEAGEMLSVLRSRRKIDWGPFRIEDGRLYLPNGGWLDYTTLEWFHDTDTGERYWRLRRRSGYTKIYGAKLVENVVQALSRVITSQAMLRITTENDYRIVGMSHDDVWVLVPDDMAEQRAYLLASYMRQRPAWAPDLPLDAEVHVGRTYGDE